jgi:hypothetical protein
MKNQSQKLQEAGAAVSVLGPIVPHTQATMLGNEKYPEQAQTLQIVCA